MRISLSGNPDFTNYNKDYNHVLMDIIDKILQTENEGMDKDNVYVHSNVRNSGYAFAMNRHEKVHLIDEGDVEVGRLSAARLGYYETKMVWHAVNNDYTNIVYAGEMGSGKTALMRQVSAALEGRSECSKCKRRITSQLPSVLRLDFSSGMRKSPHPAVQTEYFLKKWRELLLPYVDHILRECNCIDEMVEHVLENVNTLGYDGLWDICFQLKHSRGWRGKLAPEKLAALILAITRINDNHAMLDLLMKILKFLKQSDRICRACMMLWIDNIDRIEPEAQTMIFETTMELQGTAELRCVIAMRPTTFENIAGYATYSFGYSEHRPQRTSEIIKQRLGMINGETLSILPNSYRPHFERRARYILEALNPESTKYSRRLVEFLDTVAGDSVRCGLTVSQRMFVNNFIPFDGDPLNTDMLINSIMIGSGGCYVSTSDNYIPYVFMKPRDNTFDLLPMRIMQLIYALRESPDDRTPRKIVKMLNAMGYTSHKHILDSYNYLMFSKRPCIYVDGRYKYDTYTQLMACVSACALTEAGYNLLKFLATNMPYAQVIFQSINWRQSLMPSVINMKNLEDRLSLIRRGLAVLLDRDAVDCARLHSFLKAQEEGVVFKCQMISTKILAGIGSSVLRIAQAYEATATNKGVIVEEMREWHNLLLEAYNHEANILGETFGKNETLIYEFSEYIG